MKLKHIPVCYFETKILLIDDDSSLTDSISLTLRDQDIIIKNSPLEGVDYINNHYNPIINKYDLYNVEGLDDDNPNSQLQKIEEIFNTEAARNEISVIVVDYHMPGMNGLELISQLNKKDIRTILITNDQDYNIAVDAFNSGLINAYVRKDDDNFIKKLEEIISNQKIKFFENVTSSIFDYIEGAEYLSDSYCMQILFDHVTQGNIKEFYLANLQGDFVLIDHLGVASNLFLRSKAQLADLANIGSEDGASEDVVSKIRSCQEVPVFERGKSFWQIPASDWGRYMVSLSKVAGSDNSYWVLV